MSETSQPQTFAGRVALVTGAAGGGVGSATARLLAARGAGVVVNYRQSREAAERIVAEIGGRGGRAIAVQADVGEEGDVERMVALALEGLGRVDVLVSNAPAGAAHMAAFERLSWEGFATGFTGRVRAAFLTTRAVLPAMRAQGGGRLIYVGSDHADGPAAPGMIANGSGSAALVAFVRYLAYELAATASQRTSSLQAASTARDRGRCVSDSCRRTSKHASRPRCRSGAWPPRRTWPGSSPSSPAKTRGS